MNEDPIVVTSTFYNRANEVSRVREDLARTAIKNSLEEGYRVVVVDDGSPDDFLRAMEDSGAIVQTQSQRGMGHGRRQAIKAAQDLGARALLWTEPEKDLSAHLEKIFLPIEDGSAELVIVGRKSRTSYPEFQQTTEGAGNFAWETITGTNFDVFFGARGWARGLTNSFLKYDGTSWDSIHIPVVDLIHAGKRTTQVIVD